MRIFNETKTLEIENPDLTKGYLMQDRLFIAHHEAQSEIAEQSHYEVIREYPNGGKDLRSVIDAPYRAAKEAYDEYEDIQIFIPYTAEELEELQKTELRVKRERECFSIIDRSVLWYEKLTEEQKRELAGWYENWLDVTETKIVPVRPIWL